MSAQVTLFAKPPTWESDLLDALAPLIPFPAGVAVHLAIMVQPYAGRVQRGEKTVESRWAMDQRTPWRCVQIGDIIVFKLSSGPFMGWSVVGSAEFCHVAGEAARLVAERPGLGVDPGFAETVESKRYASFVHLREFHAINAEIAYGKRDQRGWVVLRERR